MLQFKKQIDTNIRTDLNPTIDLSWRQERIKKRNRRKINNVLLFICIVILLYIVLFIWVWSIVKVIYADEITEKKSVVIQKPMTTKTEKQFTSIKEILWFTGCKTIQNEEQHITDRWWHLFAMDIRCKKWVSDKVYAPLWKDTYLIDTIDTDERLWTYMILKHWEYEFVFGHTETWLKVWDRVKPGDHIWNTNKSWMSENFHLHFELWKNDYNVSYKEMLWENTLFNMQYTYDIRKQRKWFTGLNQTMIFLKDLEWFRSCPYPDNNRYSIWYGTISKANAPCITKEQAIELKRWNVDDILRSVYQNHFVPYPNQRVALASMLYNRWINSRIANIKNRHTEEWIRSYVKEFIKHNTDDKYLKWITKRHNLELNLYFNKM